MTSQTLRLRRIRCAILSASPLRLSVYAAGLVSLLFFLVGMIVSALGRGEPLVGALLPVAVLSLAAGVLVFAMYVPLFRWQRRDFDRSMGLTTTPQDRIALEVWFKHGVKPAADRLRPVLPHYIAYMERITNGAILMPAGKRFRYVLIAVAGLNFGLQLIAYAGGDGSAARVLLWGALLLLYGWMWWPAKQGEQNGFFRLFGKRNRQRLARMRRQVDQP